MEVLFDYCCQIMYALGNLLGLSYQEVCVIGNIYVQGALLVAAAALPLWYAYKQEKHYLLKAVACVNVLCCAALVFYFCFRYAPPLAASFDRCVEDLKNLAVAWHTTYVVVNIVIFVFWWLCSIALNLLSTIYVYEGKHRVSIAILLLHASFIIFLCI
jgi:hypothetical protein